MAYESARDLPKFKEMEQQLPRMRLIRLLLPKEDRRLLKDLPAQLDHMAGTVDDFYALLGVRHWVFHDDLSVDDMAHLAASHADDPEGAEQAFIAWYQEEERLPWMVQRLHGHPGLRARMDLLKFALADYEAGRYYAVVQVLLSVMDGFVNDLTPASRKGLHARKAEEMDAWDSVVGHHLGLSAAHQSFTKSFKARSDYPVHEVYRNGIVHGMLTNYNNVIVATKAWNRLFAVADWAGSLEAEKQETAKPPDPTWKEMFQQLRANDEVKTALAAFTPVTLTQGDQEMLTAHPAFAASSKYLEAWKQDNYGRMAQVITRMFGVIRPGDVRMDYQGYRLEYYDVASLEHSGAAICTIRLHVVVNGTTHSPQLRWIREGADGQTAMPNQDGEWRLMWWGLAHITQDAEPDSDDNS